MVTPAHSLEIWPQIVAGAVAQVTSPNVPSLAAMRGVSPGEPWPLELDKARDARFGKCGDELTDHSPQHPACRLVQQCSDGLTVTGANASCFLINLGKLILFRHGDSLNLVILALSAPWRYDSGMNAV